jgi:hypothetical protein
MGWACALDRRSSRTSQRVDDALIENFHTLGAFSSGVGN